MSEGQNQNIRTLKIDPAHSALDIFADPITQDVWRDKYRWGDEATPLESMARVVDGVYAKDTTEHAELAYKAMTLGLWVPGGRIHAGAGTSKAVTLINCYVDRTIEDAMTGIADALKDAMLTMQQGGGIGMDFSTLRPSGAYLQRTGAVASGPLPFMDMWNSMCSTIMSAGSRRGAMMGVMHIEHPDIIKFIEAKHEKDRLTNFNVSVLVTDAFMQCVQDDEEWHLGFHVPRADKVHLGVMEREDVPGGKWYVYQIIKARELWDKIIQSTYEYAEPGVIFIDRINDQNNLGYCETISCTNPCGEQPLPPNGACNLGAVNLARMVSKPFTGEAGFDFELLRQVVKIGVRFLDNVIDVTNYPLDAQATEERTKRRIGLGITGLANALAQLRIRYGSMAALDITNGIMDTIKNTAYEASAELAKERGTFPLYSPSNWGKNSPVVASLDSSVQELIDTHGIRNGVLLTIAPTGTTSIYMGNVSSGLEPVFLHSYKRKVRQPDNTYKDYECFDYGMKLYQSLNPDWEKKEKPSYMVTTEDLSVDDHVRMQAVCQQHIDASVSKTINCPKDITFEEFQLVYWDAYQRGCKGCTTYRPSDVRGSILSDGKEEEKAPQPIDLSQRIRPESLRGTTYKVHWPNADANYYITINDHDGKPYEVFIHSTSSKYSEWTTALSLLVSALMRAGEDITFVPRELQKVVSTHDYAWIGGKLKGSLPAMIGETLQKHLTHVDFRAVGEGEYTVEPITDEEAEEIKADTPHLQFQGEPCPKCNLPTYIFREGCKSCLSCNYSTCG